MSKKSSLNFLNTTQDKRTSRFLESSQDDYSTIKADKPFFILLDICQEMISLYSEEDRIQIDNAIRENMSYEQVALLVRDKLSEFKKQYVLQEYKVIQTLEEIHKDDDFNHYAKLQEQNMRWKALYFQEARSLIDLTKSFNEATKELGQHIEYISQLEQRNTYMEEKYLKIIENQYNEDLNDDRVELLQEAKQILEIQVKEARKTNISLAKRLSEELLKIQGSQELRIVDMQYILNLEKEN